VSASAAEPATAPAPEELGLKPNAIGFVDAVVIGLASTSPAYSLAAILGPMVAIVGVTAPGVLLASFVPMFLIASAFYYLNRSDQDAGTTFSWTTRAMGPWLGWIGGWAICMTGVLVIGSLADVAARFGLLTLGLDGAADSKATVMGLAVVVIAVMTAICVLGTELSARVQNVLIIAQALSLLTLAAVALIKVASGDATPQSVDPSVDWLDPFSAGGAALTAGLLLGVFAYWGWESAVNLTEETEESETAPGRAAVVSTVLLLLTYVGVAFAVVAFMGPDFLTENAEEEEGIFALVATEVMSGADWVVLLAVATSALASTQTTILPASRTSLSMARRGAFPSPLRRIHTRFRTPHVSTIAVGVVAAAWYVVVNLISENALFDSLTALALMIAFYYALTGIACAVFYRRVLARSARTALFVGAGPLIGAGLLLWLLVESVQDQADEANSYSGEAWFGVGPPLVIGVGFMLLGVLLMVVSRLTGPERFWRSRTEAAPADALDDRAP
jgi:amino acid transporter